MAHQRETSRLILSAKPGEDYYEGRRSAQDKLKEPHVALVDSARADLGRESLRRLAGRPPERSRPLPGLPGPDSRAGFGESPVGGVKPSGDRGPPLDRPAPLLVLVLRVLRLLHSGSGHNRLPRIEKQILVTFTHGFACRERDVAAVCRWARLCWAKRRPTGDLLMSAPDARPPQVLPRPACTPTAIRAVLAANADVGILQRYDEDLDAAFEQAREQGDVTPLVQTVKRWWFEADAWRDPQARREFLARIDTYRDEGPPPADQRMSREEIRARFGV